MTGCTFPTGMTFTADKNYTNVVFEIADGKVFYKKKAYVSLTAAQVKTSNSVPVQLIASPGSGKIITVTNVDAKRNFVSAAFAANAGMVYTKDVSDPDTEYQKFIPVNFISSAASKIISATGNVDDTPVLLDNKAIMFRMGADSATGDGSIEFYISYNITIL